MARVFATAALLLALAGCGGSSGALDQVGYEVRLAPLDDLLTRTLDREDEAVADKLRGLADELDSLQPPAPAAEANTQLVQVLRYLAEDVDERDMLAYADDWDRLQDVVYELRSKGYEPFDGPDDE